MPERVFCTIITKSYLAYARTLAASIAQHHPNGKLYVLFADRIDGYFEPESEPFEVIRLEMLADQTAIEQLCFYYTPFELCCALRGHLHEYLWNQTDVESWIFLDSDVFVFHSLETIFEQLETASLLLTPHCQTPVSIEQSDPHELNFIRSGLFNAGFLGLRRTEETQKFIHWFKERLRYYCFNDLAIGLPTGFFVDQIWLNLVPLYFPNTEFLRHPGANLGHWNYCERRLEMDENDRILANEKPLLFIHFSGWDIEHPEQVSKYSSLYAEQHDQVWEKLAQIYRASLLHHQHEATLQYPYAFDQFADGTPVQLVMRRAYFNDLKHGIQLADSPFQSVEYFQNHGFKLKDVASIDAELASLYAEISSLNLRLAEWDRSLWSTKAELHSAKSEFNVTRSHLEAMHSELAIAQAELQHLQQFKVAIENSKFWKLKQHWTRFKENFSRFRKS